MFQNEPLTDFTVEANRSALKSALDKLESRIRAESLVAYPIINGQEIRSSKIFERFDPSATDSKVGSTHFAGLAEVDSALTTVSSAENRWRNASVAERSKILQKAAQLMRVRKHDLSALIIREAGKPWKEADADVAEAIDFCDYYAQEMLRLGKAVKTQEVPGEENFYFYQPRGVCVVIAPWNFPLAIACGMVTAALVTGNTVILKPAEQTNLIAYELSKILLSAGVPKDVYAFLPGVGEEIGQALVDSPLVDMVVFTGSKPVGLKIIESAGRTKPEQRSVRKVVAEMGGKNAVIVDEDADLDQAVNGIIYSAFGFSGQKCSACSRVIVVGDAYQTFVERIGEAAADVVIGKAQDSSTLIGPVIDAEARDRIIKTIASAEARCKLVLKGFMPEGGYFVPPTIFKDVSPTDDIWKEEIFGPVLAITKAANFEEALRLANDSQYALTGGLFSRSPANIALAQREFRVGNLYINRACTGAMVCRQPFGGFKMSGIGSKAGGPDYLIQFMEPRVVTENTMRRGFAPNS